MEKILTAILATILTFAPIAFDRDFLVINARRGIDLKSSNAGIINNNISSGGSQVGVLNPPPNFSPVYQQIQQQITQLQSLTQNLYQNFGK